jgi:hypothetical protein
LGKFVVRSTIKDIARAEKACALPPGKAREMILRKVRQKLHHIIKERLSPPGGNRRSKAASVSAY